MCDQEHVNINNCPSCDNCDFTSTIGDYPVRLLRTEGYMDYYCIITDSRCQWYFDKSLNKSERNFEKGLRGPLPKAPTPAPAPALAPAPQQPAKSSTPSKSANSSSAANPNTVNKQSSNTVTNTAKTNTTVNNKANSGAANTSKSTANTNTASNNAVTNNVISNNAATNNAVTNNAIKNNAAATNTAASNNANVASNLNGTNAVNAGTVAGTIAANDATGNVSNASTIQATDATTTENDKVKFVSENSGNGTVNPDGSTSQVASSSVNSTNNSNNIDGNIKGQIGNGSNGVSPYVIGSLSFFTILLIVVGFLYVKKRKSDKDSDVDPIYRNSSVFFATPIVEKRESQRSARSQASNMSKFSAHNKTVISSADDGDFDIVISPTNVTTAAATNAATINDDVTVSRTAPGPIQAYADTSLFEGNSVSGINVSATENFISQSNINGLTCNTTSIVSPSMLSPTETSNVIVPTTVAGDISEDVISPLVPASTNQNITIQNASFSYDLNEASTHDPSVSFINSTNGISFIKSKDESYMLSPIMDKSVSNIFTADMVTENSINVDLKQLTSTPKLNNSNGKKTLSMVISEYKEDSIYNAKYNYDPSMEDEMRIRINDRVLVKEIFNDGWAYGENKTSEAFGIFPINRLDSSS